VVVSGTRFGSFSWPGTQNTCRHGRTVGWHTVELVPTALVQVNFFHRPDGYTNAISRAISGSKRSGCEGKGKADLWAGGRALEAERRRVGLPALGVSSVEAFHLVSRYVWPSISLLMAE